MLNIINSGKETDQIINDLTTNDAYPQLLLKYLDNPDYLPTIKNRLELDKTLLNERIDSMPSIPTAPIDAMLLYAFYLFEESKKNILKNEGIDFLNAYNEDDSLSITSVLVEIAHEVMEELGFFNEPIQEVVQNKRNNKKKRTITKDKATEAPNVKQIISDGLIENTENIITEHDQSNDTPFKNKLHFKLKKEHRLLDTIARLLSVELIFNGPANSVSVAWVENKYNGKLQLAISFKNFRTNEEILAAINNIVHYSKQFSIYIDDLDSYINNKKIKINNILEAIHNSDNEYEAKDLKKHYHKTRKKIDKIKFYLSLNKDPKISRFFGNKIYVNDLIILDNPFRQHSELNMINFLINEKANLDFIKDDLGNDIPYQYIGNSIGSCAKCHALINGDEINGIIGINDKASPNNMAFFMRSHYDCGYPTYYIPKFVLEINGKKRTRDLSLLLNALPSINDFTPNERFNMQIHELSDSEDELNL